MTSMTINQICKQKRDELKVSNLHIAETSGINLQTVINFLSNRSKEPSVYTVGPICRVLGVSLDAVFEIITPGMTKEEIKRLKDEYDVGQEELLRIQKEVELQKEKSAHELEMLKQKTAYQEELISAQRDTIALLKEKLAAKS